MVKSNIRRYSILISGLHLCTGVHIHTPYTQNSNITNITITTKHNSNKIIIMQTNNNGNY